MSSDNRAVGRIRTVTVMKNFRDSLEVKHLISVTIFGASNNLEAAIVQIRFLYLALDSP
jgi:hypothetical protein